MQKKGARPVCVHVVLQQLRSTLLPKLKQSVSCGADGDMQMKVCVQIELRTSKNSSTLVCASQTACSQAPDLGVQQELLKVVRPLFL